MSARSRRVLEFLVDCAAVLAIWAGMLVAETVGLGFLQRNQFSGIWEIGLARKAMVPMAAVAVAPFAPVVVAGWRLAKAPARRARFARVLLAAGAAAALAFGVSGGRHFDDGAVRAAFVIALGVLGGTFGEIAVSWIARARRHPLGLAALGVVVAAASWSGDAYVLPRLYPAFHLALFALSLTGGALIALAARSDAGAPGPLTTLGAIAVAATLADSAIGVPGDMAVARRSANLRLVLVEHAPFLGRAVALAMRVRPPDEPSMAEAPASSGPGEVARSLDWSGQSVLLLTVDALRADHVSAYGYRRATTPNIDALAREGALFERAYCPTPHTSYSITSMMTGKYLRPLLAMGLGEGSETWAQDLRRYGWRTAAFYPPAVFYIDESRFTAFEQERLGFEYAKVEFADPALREEQVAQYLDGAPADRPLFLWVHFFEPHEPYVMHPAHPFAGGPSPDVDAYDSEIAEADDGIGRIVRQVRSRRPHTAIVVTADHGEEFGEHGGRYHGTTVYEEQVRVPLVVVGPGVAAGNRASVVQTIDLLPTALSALGIPRPARIRGRDLGPVLAGAARDDGGFAFAETDDYALVASGADRLVCERRAMACALYRPADDPRERHDLASLLAGRAGELHALLRATERDHGRYEMAGAPAWPEALRRGMQGDVEAAPDVASLLDDADVAIRRKAAEVSFDLAAPAAVPGLRRALARDEDEEVRRWAALALARAGEPVPALADSLLRDPARDWRRAAALALARHGDARACDELTAWWDEAAPVGATDDTRRMTIDLPHAQDLLDATRSARCRSAVPALLRALDDVRARPFVADTLGALGDERARVPLLEALEDEPYVTTRPHEAHALLALGARDWAADPPAPDAEAAVRIPPGAARAIVLLSDSAAALSVTVDGSTAQPAVTEGLVRSVDLPAVVVGRSRARVGMHVSAGGATALWLAPVGRLD